jgi:hypothetical protein
MKPLIEMIKPIGNDDDGSELFTQPGDDTETLRPNDRIHLVTAQAWALLVEFLEGKRLLKTGNLKGKRGQPRKDPRQRTAAPLHDAADFVPAVAEVLRDEYPEAEADDIDRVARDLVAHWKHVDADELNEYMNRPPSDHHRLDRPRN